MSDELKGYYERELSFLRDMGAEFREKYRTSLAGSSSRRAPARTPMSSDCWRGSLS